MKHLIMTAALLVGTAQPAFAHDILSDADPDSEAAFDITSAAATTDGRLTTFAMEVVGMIGSEKPEPIGNILGSGVAAYVWPTALDPSRVGFDAGSGILALAITAHPDFDDTPLFDEDQDGDPGNDGADWHSHWVVLVEDQACAAGLKVRDVSPGVDLLPPTAPYFPIALDSPGMSPLLNGRQVRITVPVGDTQSLAFDAVTAALQVNPTGEAPLLCVVGVHDVASGDLSLPGRVMRQE